MNFKQPEVTKSPILMAVLQYMNGKSEAVEMNPTPFIHSLTKKEVLTQDLTKQISFVLDNCYMDDHLSAGNNLTPTEVISSI